MNEKYLWDKTGEDFEIEKLENALKSLSYRETAAPRIPVKTAPEKKSSFSFFECRNGDINWQGVYFRGAAGILLADRILTSETAEKGSMGPDLWFLWRGPGGAP